MTTAEQVIEATLDGRPLVGRTTIYGQNGRRAALEYPIVYMNVHPPIQSFQVDVGPILFTDVQAWDPNCPVVGLEMAYVMYNTFDRADETP